MSKPIAYGERPRSLSDEQIREMGMLFMDKAPAFRIAKLFGVDPTTVAKALIWGGYKTGINRCVTVKTAEYPKIVAMYRDGMTIKAIAETLNLCTMNVSNILKRNNVHIRGEEPDEHTRKTVVNDYLKGMSFIDIHATHGFTFGYVKKMLKHEGMKSRPCVLHSIDETFFERIDSHVKAYWVGMLMADGCVHWNRPKTHIGKLTISLTEADSYLLDQFVAVTKYTGPIRRIEYEDNGSYNRRPGRILGIYNARFVSPLAQYGLSPNKSVNHPFFTNIPLEFLPSAILGYFDGDGSISFSAKDNNRLSASFICSIEFATKLRDTLHSHNVKCSMRIRTLKSGLQMGEVRLKGNRSCLGLYRFMYQGNIPSLKRKREKFEWVLEQQKLGLMKDTSIKDN